MMKRTQLYIPDSLHRILKKQARTRKCSTSHLIREYLEEATTAKEEPVQGGAKVLLEMMQDAHRLAGNRKTKAPSDLAENHDYYLYGDGRIE